MPFAYLIAIAVGIIIGLSLWISLCMAVGFSRPECTDALMRVLAHITLR